MRLEWSEAAEADRNYIYDYIDANNPRAAIAVDDRIEEAIERLLHFPMSGRIGRVEGTRELVIDRTPYIAAYRLRMGADDRGGRLGTPYFSATSAKSPRPQR